MKIWKPEVVISYEGKTITLTGRMARAIRFLAENAEEIEGWKKGEVTIHLSGISTAAKMTKIHEQI